ncbi:MAG: hypothetical protein HY323_03460 [Betaproteobacteria bacterium]|nr:hypothetical protein [Betaproteobacteria bacterium]
MTRDEIPNSVLRELDRMEVFDLTNQREVTDLAELIDIECPHEAPACECTVWLSDGVRGSQTCPVHAPEWDERSER